MGYTTDFTGQFNLNAPLTKEQTAYLQAFSQTRRMKRNPAMTEALQDELRVAVGLPVGEDGEYFVGTGDRFGQDRTGDVVDYNRPPASQPGLWCQWTASDAGDAIVWDEGEKFYSYVEWLEYIIKHFIAPWGYTLNGTVQWSGEDSDDIGHIVVADNVVRVLDQVEFVQSGSISDGERLGAIKSRVLHGKDHPSLDKFGTMTGDIAKDILLIVGVHHV